MEEVLEKDWLSLDYDFGGDTMRWKPNHALRVVYFDGWVVEDMSEWEVDGRDGIAADIKGTGTSTLTRLVMGTHETEHGLAWIHYNTHSTPLNTHTQSP